MIRSRATAALLRLKEIDNKYKVRYDESKNDARSSVNTDSLSDEDGREENSRPSSASEKLEILKPTLNIKIPDTYAEQLDSGSSSSNEVSPSPKVSTVDKTPVATPRVSTINKNPVATPRVLTVDKTPVATPRVESTSEIQEVLDEGESIAEILEESDDTEGIYSDKSNREMASLASSIENLSTRNEESNMDYSNDSFENDTSEAKSFNSGCSKNKYPESCVDPQKSSVPEEDEISLTNIGGESVGSKNEDSYTPQLFERSRPEEIEIEEQTPIFKESQSSQKLNDSLLAELNLKLSKDIAVAEESGRNEDLSSSLKFTHSLHEQSDTNQGILKDSKSVDTLASSDELSTSLKAKNTSHSKSNAKLSERSSITDGCKKHGESSTSAEAKNTSRSKSNAKLSERTSITDGGEKHGESSTSIEEKNAPCSISNVKPSKHSFIIEGAEKHKEWLTTLEVENTQHSKSNAKPSKSSSITDGGEKQNESSRSRKTAQSPPQRSEPNPNTRGTSNPTDVESLKFRASADAFFKLDAKKDSIRSRKKSSKILIKGRKESKDCSHVIGNEPDADSFECRSSSRRCSSREITEQRSASSDEQPEVEPARTVERTARKSRSTFEVRSSRDPSRIAGRKFSDRKKRVPTSGSHRRSKSLRTSKSAPINRGKAKELFEHGDRELERLRARMSDLRLEQERQLMLCYLRDSDEERRRLMMLSSRFYCPGKPEVSAIEPLDLPNVANFVKPDRTGVRCSVLFPDDRLELVKSRLADIRQWLKDQFILYRDYSDVASAINAKYVTDAVAVEKVSIEHVVI